MSVASVTILDDGHSGKSSGNDTVTAARELMATLMVSCNARGDTPDTVMEFLRTHSEYPWNGRTYKIGNSTNSGMECVNIDVRRMAKSGKVSNEGVDYIAAASFKPRNTTIELQVQKQDGSGKPSTNPYLWRDEISISNYTVTVPAESGTFQGYYPANVNGNKLGVGVFGPITNSAFQRFDPPPEREVSVTVVRITKTASTVFPHLYQRYIGSVNNDNVIINKGFYGLLYRFGPYQGKIKDLNNVFDIANGIPYWRQTIELHVNPLGWRRYILDQGDDELFAAQEAMDGVTISNSDVGANGFIKRRVLDPRGNPVRGLLDGNGHLLKKGSSPVFLIYQIDNELPFAGINW